ncbi:pectin lyase-like protein [Ephemerocybe angulata]|uniref:galacturonan 1,4-alpha-galacturonidase n=1 Tax=Ephemerocybe angulata TaxID=980116 RepID=A0A8H6HLP9_9AGAR|nr:pectin lyase-like protein [Tulosesus angulatus]
MMLSSLLLSPVLLAFSAASAALAAPSALKTFTVPHVDGQDDTPALLAALPDYASNSTILFKQGVHYNIWTPIKFPVLNNVEIRIEGNLSYPEDMATVQAIVASSTFPGHWFTFTGGDKVSLIGSTNPKWGWVDAHGQQWWNKHELTNRPHGWNFAKISNGVIRNMKLWKPVAWSFSASGSTNLHAHDNWIYALSDDMDNAFPFNTDGFSAGGGTDFLFENNHIQNGDDCLTVGNGAKNIVFRNSRCEGGHGLSIGSLGKGGQVADVQNVLIENVEMKNALYAARFKSWTGGKGVARNITWRNIKFDNVRFPIYVTQNYWDQNLGPKPEVTDVTNTQIQDMLFENFVGNINDSPTFFEGTCVSDPCWYYVPGATGREVIIFDLYPETVKNIAARRIVPVTQKWKPANVMCNSTVISTDVGFKCQNGLFVPTLAGLFGH